MGLSAPPLLSADRFSHGALPELTELHRITVAIASADAPHTIIGQILALATEVAEATTTALLVTPEQAMTILPTGDVPDDEILLRPGARIVCRGPIADQIRDWEGAPEPFLTGDGTRLYVPLPNGGMAVHEPRCGVLADPRQMELLQILACLAAGTVQVATRMAEAESRNRALELTRQRLREQNVLLQGLAIVDELTGLHNRRFFDSRLAYELERFSRYRHPLSVVLFDIDHFKQVNDTYGHAVGDGVLRHLARLGQSALRKVDVFCRYGGEEFAVILPDTGPTGASRAATRVRQIVEANPLLVEGTEVRVTVSAGTAAVDETWSGDAEAFVRAADRALYQAKQLGRNRVVLAREP